MDHLEKIAFRQHNNTRTDRYRYTLNKVRSYVDRKKPITMSVDDTETPKEWYVVYFVMLENDDGPIS